MVRSRITSFTTRNQTGGNALLHWDTHAFKYYLVNQAAQGIALAQEYWPSKILLTSYWSKQFKQLLSKSAKQDVETGKILITDIDQENMLIHSRCLVGEKNMIRFATHFINHGPTRKQCLIGTIHTHPGGTAFSPQDILLLLHAPWALINIILLPNNTLLLIARTQKTPKLATDREQHRTSLLNDYGKYYFKHTDNMFASTLLANMLIAKRFDLVVYRGTITPNDVILQKQALKKKS